MASTHANLSDRTKLPPSANGKSTQKKRNRPILSCVTCHERRVRCDRGRPCESCFIYGTPDQCTYAPRPNKRQRNKEDDGPQTTQQQSNHSPAVASTLQPLQPPFGGGITSSSEGAKLTREAPSLNFNLFVERVSISSELSVMRTITHPVIGIAVP